MRPRGGGPSHGGAGHAHPVPTTTTLQFPQCALEALNQVSRHVRLSGHNRNRTIIGQLAEWQSLIDNDIFCLTHDRRTTRLTAVQQFHLVHLLAQFFSEKSDDPNKYAYFEVIFLGREGETVQHDHRIKTLFMLASFALQYPVLQIYMQISQWLTKVGNQKPYAENLVEMLVDHFIAQDSIKDKSLYEYLLPLEVTCPEFTVFFLTYAPRYSPMNDSLAAVLSSYLTRNTGYVLNQFRDSPHLAEEFASHIFPKLLEYVLVSSDSDDSPTLVSLTTGLILLTQRWHTKVKDFDLNLDLLLSNSMPWTRKRCDIMCTLNATSAPSWKLQQKRLAALTIPATYKDILDRAQSAAAKAK